MPNKPADTVKVTDSDNAISNGNANDNTNDKEKGNANTPPTNGNATVDTVNVTTDADAISNAAAAFIQQWGCSRSDLAYTVIKNAQPGNYVAVIMRMTAVHGAAVVQTAVDRINAEASRKGSKRKGALVDPKRLIWHKIHKAMWAAGQSAYDQIRKDQGTNGKRWDPRLEVFLLGIKHAATAAKDRAGTPKRSFSCGVVDPVPGLHTQLDLVIRFKAPTAGDPTSVLVHPRDQPAPTPIAKLIPSGVDLAAADLAAADQINADLAAADADAVTADQAVHGAADLAAADLAAASAAADLAAADLGGDQ